MEKNKKFYRKVYTDTLHLPGDVAKTLPMSYWAGKNCIFEIMPAGRWVDIEFMIVNLALAVELFTAIGQKFPVELDEESITTEMDKLVELGMIQEQIFNPADPDTIEAPRRRYF